MIDVTSSVRNTHFSALGLPFILLLLIDYGATCSSVRPVVLSRLPAPVAPRYRHLGSSDPLISLLPTSFSLSAHMHLPAKQCGRLRAATREQKLCPLGCTNRLSLIKLSCSSDLADGYFHCWATSCNEIWSQSGGMWRTHTLSHLDTHTHARR